MKMLILRAALIAAAFAAIAASAQTVGGNASIAVTGMSSNVELPQPSNGPTGFPALRIEYALGATQEVFYQLGSVNTVTAVVPSLPSTQGSPALPANGVCLFIGPNNWLAAITATSTATIRLTQLTTCPP